jgi:hypothetical protein
MSTTRGNVAKNDFTTNKRSAIVSSMRQKL